MFRVTSLTEMSDAQLSRWIKRLALLLLAGTVAFAAFYAIDRWRPPAAPIVDREMAALEEAVRADPSDISARGRLADVYMGAERYQDAITQYTQIIETGKADKQGYASRARAYLVTGELDAAAADYTKVVELTKDTEMANVDPALEAAYYGLGSIALQQDRPLDAIDNLNKALAINRTDADAMDLLGSAYLKAGQPDKAVEALTSAVSFVPIGWSEPYRTLADAYLAAGQPALAEWATAMADLADGKPADAEARLRTLLVGDAAVQANVGLGLVMEVKGDPSSAADWYARALALDADNVSAKLGLSRTGAPAASAPASSPKEGNDQ
jgi:tetratricopeptide (TPR) repeat protein